MDFKQLIKARRTIRLFRQNKIPAEKLTELVECARLAPAAANVQALEYVIIDQPQMCSKIFDCLAWAGYVKPKRNPPENMRPVAYIIVISDNTIKQNATVDAAAAIENILLAAKADGIGSCWLGAIDRNKIAEIIAAPQNYYIDSVIALGQPAEEPIAEDAKSDDIKYYLDENNRLHVPKRPLSRILHTNKFGQ